MRYHWLNKQEKKHLILFFNGWGCDEHQFKHLESEEYDVLVLYDYQTLNLDTKTLNTINNYNTISVIAWSFGVWIAHYTCEQFNIKINHAVAINGTTQPIHDKHGLSRVIVQGTLDHLTERNLTKFQRRMLGSNKGWETFETNKPQRELQQQKEELSSLIQHFNLKITSNPFYHKAVIGSEDLIFLSTNQKDYWKNKVDIQEIKAPHFCFYHWNKWSEIIN